MCKFDKFSSQPITVAIGSHFIRTSPSTKTQTYPLTSFPSQVSISLSTVVQRRSWKCERISNPLNDALESTFSIFTFFSRALSTPTFRPKFHYHVLSALTKTYTNTYAYSFYFSQLHHNFGLTWFSHRAPRKLLVREVHAKKIAHHGTDWEKTTNSWRTKPK